jgi:hypothetical protein
MVSVTITIALIHDAIAVKVSIRTMKARLGPLIARVA